MQDKPDKKKTSADAEGDDAVEQRIDRMLDPKLPDEAPPPVPGSVIEGDSPASSDLPPLNIFEDPRSAPDVPQGLLSGEAAGAGEAPQADPPQPAAAQSEPIEPTEASTAPVVDELDNPETEKMVDDIAAKDSDDLLEAEDEKIAKAFETPPPEGSKIKRLLKSKWTWVLVAVLALAVTAAVPFTRYKVLALFMKQDFSIEVLDSKTHTVVSGASIKLAGQTARTDSAGKAKVRVPVGHQPLRVNKEYYKTYAKDVLVTLGKQPASFRVQLNATGRQVPIKVVNKITGQPLAGAEVKVLDTEAKVDDSGQATIVLPTSAATQTATVSINGYNTLKAKVEVTSKVVAGNTFELTPNGKVYFLSNLSGHIDVVKANLDGSSRQTILAGSGNEDSRSTALLASRDWQYLALLSKRDGEQHAKLYLIDTKSGNTTTMDSSNGDFQTIGWYGHNFVYSLSQASIPEWKAGRQLLKSYDADSGKATVLDKNSAAGSASSYAYQMFYNFNIVGDRLIYTTQWYTVASGDTPIDLAKQKAAIRSIDLNRRAIHDYQTFAANKVNYINAVVPSPGVINFVVGNYNSDSTFYEFRNNVFQPSHTTNQQTFEKSYPTYLISPSGQQTFWAEVRDGKNTLLVGDDTADGAKAIAILSEYSPYGWYGNDYLLISKGGSELYIIPASKTSQKPLKITDYYKPTFDPNNFGYAYGGV